MGLLIIVQLKQFDWEDKVKIKTLSHHNRDHREYKPYKGQLVVFYLPNNTHELLRKIIYSQFR